MLLSIIIIRRAIDDVVIATKMKRYLTTFFICLLTGIVPVSCDLFCLNNCGCGSTVRDISITDLDLKTIGSAGTNLDTSATYSYDQIFKLIYIANWQVVKTDTPPPALHFMSTAYACSPRDQKAIQKIQSLKIKARNAFALNTANDEIKAGDDITNRFGMSYYTSGTFIDINFFIEDMRDIYAYDMYSLRLKERPFQQVSMKLEFIIEMTDGMIYTFDEEIMKAN